MGDIGLVHDIQRPEPCVSAAGANLGRHRLADRVHVDDSDTWTPAALNKFLTNPGHVRPGTGMPYMIPDAKQRAGVIAYLKTLHEKQ